MQTKISRAEAKAQGLKHYFTGKPCKRGHVAKRYAANETCSVCHDARYKTTEVRAKRREWQATYRKTERHRAYSESYYKREDVKARARHGHLSKKFGITLEQFRVVLAAQGNRCGICRAPEMGGSGQWHVDHDHASGKVRGILCRGCNVAIGAMRDNPDTLRAAIQYLEESARFPEGRFKTILEMFT